MWHKVKCRTEMKGHHMSKTKWPKPSKISLVATLGSSWRCSRSVLISTVEAQQPTPSLHALIFQCTLLFSHLVFHHQPVLKPAVVESVLAPTLCASWFDLVIHALWWWGYESSRPHVQAVAFEMTHKGWMGAAQAPKTRHLSWAFEWENHRNYRYIIRL